MKRAFTLIELLVVISIIIILLAVAVPTIRALTKGNNQKQAVNLMTTMLANARATAISTRKCSGIVVYEYPPTPLDSNGLPNPTLATSFIQLITQSKYDGAKKVRYFMKSPGSGPQRLPGGIQAATLDMGANSFRTQASNTNTASGGVLGSNCRVILFDSNGQMLLANGVAIDPTIVADPVALAWNMRGDISVTRGSSSPGFLIYDAGLFAASHTANAANDATWMRQNSDVVVVNAYTGGVIR